jgi:hypothetical protein
MGRGKSYWLGVIGEGEEEKGRGRPFPLRGDGRPRPSMAQVVIPQGFRKAHLTAMARSLCHNVNSCAFNFALLGLARM